MSRVLGAAVPLSAAARLQLMWLASPALPVGGFSYSEGLEAAVESGLVTNEATAGAWLRDQLYLSLARSDMAVVAKALPAWQRHDLARITELNDWIVHTRETTEFKLQAEQMGRSLVEWVRNRGASVAPNDPRLAQCAALKPAPTWPVAFALAVAQCLPDNPASTAPHANTVKDTLLSFAFGWAENMVQAAIKSVPLGQSAGQRILQSLIDDLPAAIDHACALPDSQRQAFTPMLAILSSQHETQYSRLFRS
ncbi:MAG: urease accessory UreF family protein [Aquabacterium sp.]|uniref:urease accessory protein UreF n=1 Tax=Aquabacterium sp. TaxID=1872578 RepID=UPI00271A47CE|nr:urease accessory UreF family protein [Aquabacterium sp.]MDO9004458.1 urease accessory UreF family protein [Aquabacterium sp.]